MLCIVQYTRRNALGAVPGQVLVADVRLHGVHPRVDGRLHESPQLREARADPSDAVTDALYAVMLMRVRWRIAEWFIYVACMRAGTHARTLSA